MGARTKGTVRAGCPEAPDCLKARVGAEEIIRVTINNFYFCIVSI